MTKKIEEEKKLVWKFKELPTAGEVAELVETKVITPEEARQILFKEEVKQSDEVEALKEMVNTLQEMVKDLLKRPRDVQVIPYERVVTLPNRYTPYWDKYWMSSSVDSSAVQSDGRNTVYTLSVSQ